MMLRQSILAAACLAVLLDIGSQQVAFSADAPSKAAKDVPTFQYDPDWPKPLPNAWVTGNIGAMYMGKDDHLWIVQRPNSVISLGERDAVAGFGECCAPAPPVIEFNPAGDMVQAWGPVHVTDPDTKAEKLIGKQVSGPYPDGLWPSNEHAIYVDHKSNVWISNQRDPSQLVKFTRDGKFLLRIGTKEATSSNDKANLAGPAGVYVDAKRNEVFVADGYRNRRIVVFDADTGAYKRHWGAYGKPPTDPQQVGNIGPDLKKQREQLSVTHCITASNDELLYVCDRANGRVQVFRKDGKYVREVFIAPRDGGLGTVFAIAFSADPEQRFMYVGDGSNKKIWILNRSDLSILGSFGTGGREGGRFMLIHTMVTDSQGNLYVGETIDNNRVQRFLFKGMSKSSAP
jgi:DNA-binding beta-propeller fold protein YncE